MSKPNFVVRHATTTVIGNDTPLDYVSSYVYNYDQGRVELGFEVRSGTRTRTVEAHIEKDAGRALAKRLAIELKMTREDFAMLPATPQEEDEEE